MLLKLTDKLYESRMIQRIIARDKKTASLLLRLFPGQAGKDGIRAFYRGKIRNILLVLVIGFLLSFLCAVKAVREKSTSYTGELARVGSEVTLIAETSAGEEIGTFPVRADMPLYTKEEADALFEELNGVLTETILNGNASANAVETDLSFPKQIDPYPFQLSYGTDAYLFVRYDGSIVSADLPEEGVTTSVRVTAAYADWEWTTEIPLHLVRARLSGEEERKEAIFKAIDAAKEESRFDETIPLPTRILEEPLYWRKVTENKSGAVLAMTFLLAVFVYLYSDIRLKKEVSQREEELKASYPSFVTRLTLYLRAGMTLRSALARMEEGGSAGAPEDAALSMELTRMVQEMKNGISEQEALGRFANRVSLNEYTRLVSLLIQNVTRGSGALLALMNEEAKAALEERLNLARTKGEQASTKLMLPMMLMLGIVMFLVMVPAYLSF